jgi:hypothetical protein
MTHVVNNTDRNDPNVPEFIVKDTLSVQGITDDFAWYESEVMLRDMNAWESRFKRLVSVMEARRKEHLHMIASLLKENTQLKKERDEYIARSAG